MLPAGYITKEDLQKVCLDLGEKISDEELDEILKKCDPESGEKISFPLFYQNMKDVIAVDKKKRGVAGRN